MILTCDCDTSVKENLIKPWEKVRLWKKERGNKLEIIDDGKKLIWLLWIVWFSYCSIFI